MAHNEHKQLPIDLLAPCRRRVIPLPRVSPRTLALIEQHGVFEPLVVRPLPDQTHYEILTNVKSWLAAQHLGIESVPVSVLCVNDTQADELIDAHRDGPLVRARRYRDALDAFGGEGRRGAIVDVAAYFGVSRSTVAHALRVLNLPELIQEALDIGALSNGHAKALAGVTERAQQMNLAHRTISEGWSVRRLEAACREGVVPETVVPARSADTRRLEQHLTELLGSPVHVDDTRGVIEIDYGNNPEVREGILERLGWCETEAY